MCSIRTKRLIKQHVSLTRLADRRSLWCVILGAPPVVPVHAHPGCSGLGRTRERAVPKDLAPGLNLDLYLPRTPVLTGAETARVMGYPTTDALYKARQAGRLPIEMFRLPGRRGWFAATPSVKAWLEASFAPSAHRTSKEE